MISKLLSTTCSHLRSNGSALTYVAYAIPCSPADPIQPSLEDYPNEKLYTTRQVFTRYADTRNGDYLLLNGKVYAIKQVDFWDEIFPMDDYYHLRVEEDNAG